MKTLSQTASQRSPCHTNFTRYSGLFARAVRNADRRQAERIRKAGKHVCIPVCSGELTRLTGRGGRILKRPVEVMKFYECKICGRDMTSREI